MALNYVTVICDLYDGSGNVLGQGSAAFEPSAALTDSTDREIITTAPVTVSFTPADVPSVRLLATDNAAPVPGGWEYLFTPPGGTGMSAFTFLLPFSGGATQYLSSLMP